MGSGRCYFSLDLSFEATCVALPASHSFGRGEGGAESVICGYID